MDRSGCRNLSNRLKIPTVELPFEFNLVKIQAVVTATTMGGSRNFQRVGQGVGRPLAIFELYEKY